MQRPFAGEQRKRQQSKRFHRRAGGAHQAEHLGAALPLGDDERQIAAHRPVAAPEQGAQQKPEPEAGAFQGGGKGPGHREVVGPVRLHPVAQANGRQPEKEGQHGPEQQRLKHKVAAPAEPLEEQPRGRRGQGKADGTGGPHPAVYQAAVQLPAAVYPGVHQLAEGVGQPRNEHYGRQRKAAVGGQRRAGQAQRPDGPDAQHQVVFCWQKRIRNVAAHRLHGQVGAQRQAGKHSAQRGAAPQLGQVHHGIAGKNAVARIIKEVGAGKGQREAGLRVGYVHEGTSYRVISAAGPKAPG